MAISKRSRPGSGRETIRLVCRTGGGFEALAIARPLVRNGVGPRLAKKIVEDLTEYGVSTVCLDLDREVSAALHKAGVAIERGRQDEIDVRAVRARTGLSQRDFARRYGLAFTTVQNWEQKRSRPDAAGRALLRIIAADPVQAATLLARTPG
ncbi:MAG: helix-turn-helix domain-containing protein [Rhodospirillaceae bacterium]|nr:helix-turn-helix domain-containing protein [Rhodospirillaceae bacterium]MCY4064980.1 helix-turn-helix domain-containing protein [Rhodospirillaceae bacterium]